MPLPTPRPTDTRLSFIARCMSSLADEFPDQAQRAAVCFRQWRTRSRAAGSVLEEAGAPGWLSPAQVRAFEAGEVDLPSPALLGYLPPDTPRCWHHHLGLWCLDPPTLLSMVALFQQGALPGRLPPPEGQLGDRRLYDVTREGVAVIELHGPLTKGESKFPGTSSVLARRAVRVAAQDDDVSALLLHVDSPGGHIAGIEALAAEVAQARLRKPVTAHIDDLGASAAYWVASQAERVTANATAEIGSIGTIAVVEDTSGRMDRLGVKVHVITTAPFKAIGIDGVPLSESALAYLEARIAAVNAHFLRAVQQGRRLSDAGLSAASDGRVHIAAEAQRFGLVDAVQSLDTTLAQVAQQVGASGSGRALRSTHQERQARLAALTARLL